MAQPAYAAERPGAIVDLMGARSLARDAVLVVAMSLLTALLAQVQIRLAFTPVPITGQTFAFLMAGAALGARRGIASQLLYLLMGAVGLPVFAGGAAHLAIIAGASGGYLLGGAVCAYGVGLLAERGWGRTVATALLAMAVGEFLVYVPGLLDLARFVPPSQLLTDGLYPFIPGDILKVLVVTALLPLSWRLVGGRPTA